MSIPDGIRAARQRRHEQKSIPRAIRIVRARRAAKNGDLFTDVKAAETLIEMARQIERKR